MATKLTAMTEGSIWKKILFFSVPLILGNLFQQLYNTVDSIIVGNFIGSNALAAVSCGGSVINLLIGFCVGASTGAGVVIAQFYGAQDKEGVRKSVHTTIAIALVAGVVITVVGILLTPLMLRMMGTPAEVYDDAVLYLQVYFGGMFFSVIYNMSAGILNAVGNSKKSLFYLMIAAITNIFLDLIFVIGLQMGVVGVALATDISQLISCILILRFLMKSDDVYKVRVKEIRFYNNLLGRIIKIGLPTGIQNIVTALSNVIIQTSINSFGTIVMAGYASYVKIDGFNILPVMSFSMAATTFTGQNIGAGRYDRVKKGMKVSLAMGMGYTICTGIILLSFGSQVMGIFTTEQAVVECGVYMMRFFCPFYFILAYMHIMAGTIRGTGNTLPPMLIILFSLCVFRITWIATVLPKIGKLYGLIMVYPMSFIIGAVLITIYAKFGKWIPEQAKKGQ
ncbi:MAG: MATE family efflux transporter [Dorea sp.]